MMHPGVGHELVEYTEAMKAYASEQSSRRPPLKFCQAGGSLVQAGEQPRCPKTSQKLISPFGSNFARDSDATLPWVWNQDVLAESLTFR